MWSRWHGEGCWKYLNSCYNPVFAIRAAWCARRYRRGGRKEGGWGCWFSFFVRCSSKEACMVCPLGWSWWCNGDKPPGTSTGWDFSRNHVSMGWCVFESRHDRSVLVIWTINRQEQFVKEGTSSRRLWIYLPRGRKRIPYILVIIAVRTKALRYRRCRT